MIRYRYLPLALIFALAACAAPQGRSGKGVTVRPPAPMPSLIGYDVRRLTALFGQPDIDLSEGRGRKLQFVNDQCVLDAFLYPYREGAKPVTTFIDTRDRQGNDVAPDPCLRSLKLP